MKVSEREAARLVSLEMWGSLRRRMLECWVRAICAKEDPKLIAEIESLIARCVEREATMSSICFL